MRKLKNKGDSGCQWNKENYYCPECHATTEPHAKGCKSEKLTITSSARFPRKNASKKVWEKFYNKFVLQEDLKEKLKELDKEKKKYERLSRHNARLNTSPRS